MPGMALRFGLPVCTTLGLAVTTLPASAASFDCARAIGADEITVCAQPGLSELDTELAGLWFAYSAFPFLMGRSGVRRDEAEQFLRDRAACGADTDCLRQAYLARIEALQHGVIDAIQAMAAEQEAAAAGGLPAPVAALIAGYAPQCRELGGKLADDQPFTLTADFDGDGRTDYLLDPQNLRCDGAATAFCGNGGCQISIALSGNGYAEPIAVLGGQPTVVQGESGADVASWVDRSNCQLTGRDQTCWAAYSWPGGRLRQTYVIKPSPG